MFLQIDDLTIRRPRLQDCRDLFEFLSLSEVARYQLWEPWSYEQVEAAVAEQTRIASRDPGSTLQLVVEREQRVIGDCQLAISVDARQAEIGYSFHPQYSGKGYATRAVTMVLGIAFIHLGVHRICAMTDPNNERSIRLLERIGMRREGHLLQNGFVRGEWVDSYLYAMLDSEWTSTHRSLSEELRQTIVMSPFGSSRRSGESGSRFLFD